MGQKYKSEGKEILYALRCAGARALYKKRSERRLLPDFLHQVRRMVSPKPPIGFPTPPIGISTPPIEISKPPIENTTPPIEKSKPPIEKRSPGPRRKLGRKPAMKPPFFCKTFSVLWTYSPSFCVQTQRGRGSKRAEERQKRLTKQKL